MAAAAPTLGFESLRRARATVEDFVRSYFLLHRLPTDAFLNFMDVLIFVEASIYESDERNEDAAAAGAGLGEEPAKPRLDDAAARDAALGALVSFLKERGLLDERVRLQLEEGLEYWALERRLCADPLAATVEEAQKALSMKSFDYRVLHLVLHQLLGRPYREPLLAFMRQAELLVEVEDDLKDYHKDVLRNSFNIYRTYVSVHKEKAPERIAAFIATVEGSYLEQRARALDEELLALHVQRNEEQASAGPAMAPSAGCWQIPAPVLEEGRFRTLSEACGGKAPPLFVPSTVAGPASCQP